MVRDVENTEDLPNLPAPLSYQILHITMVMMCCIVLQQNDTTLQQFWLFKANSPPQTILKESAEILAIYRRT
jgi:hypothetical protein